MHGNMVRGTKTGGRMGLGQGLTEYLRVSRVEQRDGSKGKGEGSRGVKGINPEGEP